MNEFVHQSDININRQKHEETNYHRQYKTVTNISYKKLTNIAYILKKCLCKEFSIITSNENRFRSLMTEQPSKDLKHRKKLSYLCKQKIEYGSSMFPQNTLQRTVQNNIKIKSGLHILIDIYVQLHPHRGYIHRWKWAYKLWVSI